VVNAPDNEGGEMPLPELLERLERLWQKLEDEGRYTVANTVALAIDAIKAGHERI